MNKESEIIKFIKKVKGKNNNWVEKVQEKYPTQFPESKDVYRFCHNKDLAKKNESEDKDYKTWLEKLRNDAKAYWKREGNEPKDETAKLLIPLLGHDEASTLLTSNAILYRHPHLKRFLKRE